MLDELKNIELPDLLDLLSEYTSTYTKLLAENTRSDEFITAREMIRLIQGEIQMRKSRGESVYRRDHNSSPDPNEQANA